MTSLGFQLARAIWRARRGASVGGWRIRRSGCHRAEIWRPGSGASRGRRHILAPLTRLAVWIQNGSWKEWQGELSDPATAQRRPLL